MKIQMPAPDIDLLQLPSLMLPAVSLAAIVGEPDTLRLSVNLTRPTSLPDGGYQLTRTQVVGMVDWLVRWLARRDGNRRDHDPHASKERNVNVWMIWFKSGDHIWLSSTWEGPDSLLWRRRIEDSRRLAHQRGYDIRVQLVDVPGVRELFESPRATAQARPMDWKMWGDSEVTYPLPVEAKTKP